MPHGLVCVCSMLVLFGFPSALLAHAGHGTTPPDTVSHYVAEPVHVAPLLAIVVVIVAGISLLVARLRRCR